MERITPSLDWLVIALVAIGFCSAGFAAALAFANHSEDKIKPDHRIYSDEWL